MDPLDRAKWIDPWWRLNNLYTIVNDDSADMRFVPNAEQREFYENLWRRNLILKARQLGFTTFVDLLILDQCLFNRNMTGAIIAHSLDDASRIFRNKVQQPYRKLPQLVRDMVPLEKETSSEMVFTNGSSISVSTSVRSGTVNFLHVSEMGKIVRKYPERAREIVTGSFEAVPKDGFIVVESTAEGASGWFYDACLNAQKRQAQGTPASPLDFRQHFFPWWRKKGYELPADGVIFTDTLNDYFRTVQMETGQVLTLEQRAWYAKKASTLGEDMKREYPTTQAEAFAQNTEGRIYGREMLLLRELGRIGKVPLRESVPVNTFWDLGLNDNNTIWLHQRVGATNRFLRFFTDSNRGMRHYHELLEQWRSNHKAKWGKHYLPHDGDNRIQGFEVTTRKQMLEELGFRDIVIVPRISDIRDGLDATRQILPECEFDEEGCAEGIECLDNYSRKWDEHLGRWSNEPLHDRFSDGADAFRQFAQAYRVSDGAPRARTAQTVYSTAGY